MPQPTVSRRRFLTLAGAAAGVGLGTAPGALIDKALAAAPAPGRGASLKDIKHVVILMQENRSFDHYFGTMKGVRGFGDRTSYRSYRGGPATNPKSVWSQTTVHDGKPLLTIGGQSHLNPFELVSQGPGVAGQTINDITHDW